MINTTILFLIIFTSIMLGYYLGSITSHGIKKISIRRIKKVKNKKQILQLLKKKRKIKNDDVERLLKVSDATATRYLNELEKEKKIVQHGETGRSVFYTLLQN